ncbi:hypothetical protein [Cryomorpha ignava]|uniref:hypothetical protein n=1 Tax=Cryomorpha ignava TaxID=101383 RepID=UPI001953E695|nr:hypothetical protein [Cryomorpha ignava]
MPDKRTKFLRALCTLSGVNAIYGIISGITTAISPPDVDDTFIVNLFEQLEKYELPIADLQDDVKEYYLNLMLDLGNFGAANFLFFAIQLIGIFMMYRLNRIGFTLYTVAQIGLAAAPIIFGSFNDFGKITFAITLVWNAIWVIMYATQIKYFHK